MELEKTLRVAKIWLDDSQVNFDEDAFGLYVAAANPSFGPKENRGEYHDMSGQEIWQKQVETMF